MKKLAFGLTITISTMLFSCAADSSNEAVKRGTNSMLPTKFNNDHFQEPVSKTIADPKQFDHISDAIDANIKALNKVEAELLKEFDLK